MVKIKKYANVVERFLHGEKGQRFFNFAYSIGAAIVIWGALFKILHLPGGSTLLCIGMGTEIAMFILTAFDRPPKEYSWEDVFPQLDHNAVHDGSAPMFPSQGAAGGGVIIQGGADGAVPRGAAQGGGVFQGGVVMGGLPGGYAPAPVEEGAEFAPAQGGFIPATAGFAAPQREENALGLTEEDTEQIRESVSKFAAAGEQLDSVAELAKSTGEYLSQINGIAEQMASLQQSATGYAEQMEDLNRNISGLNTIYSIQLKSISAQLESIDRVNRGLKDIRDMYEKSANQSSRYCEETEKMARYMKQLNSVYEKMITAMTINMANPMMGAAPGAAPVANPFSSSEAE